MAAMKPQRPAAHMMRSRPAVGGADRLMGAGSPDDGREMALEDMRPSRKMKKMSKGGASKKAAGGGFLSSVSNFFGSSSSSTADAAPRLKMAKASAAPMMAESMDAMAMDEGCAAPENFEMKQQMAFQSQAIGDLTSQVRRKQAAVRSKKSML